MKVERAVMDPTVDSSAKLRRLADLERECAQLRADLGVKRRRVSVAESAPHPHHALIGQLASDFLSVHSADGVYLWASHSCERLFGYAPASLVGRSAYEFFHPEDLERVCENHQHHATHEEAAPIDYRMRTADGGYRWVQTRSRNTKDAQGVPIIVCCTRDVQAQRDQLQEVHALLDHLQGPQPLEEQGHLPLCAWCKSVRDEEGAWASIEVYLSGVTRRALTHGICPGCVGRAEARGGGLPER